MKFTKKDKEKIVEEILDHQSLDPEKEVCGFILADKRVWPMVNVSENPDMFIFDPYEVFRVYQQLKPVAIYHTHVKGEVEPSELDKKAAKNSNLPMWIVGANKKLYIYD